MALAAFVAVFAVVLTVLLSKVFTLDFGVRAGIAAGALTSTPTLAGAQDAIASGLATLPEGVTASQAQQNVGVGYAITYIVGTAGGLLVIGIVIGYLSSLSPTFGRVPAAARYILMELGLMMFMVGVGLGAGGGIVDALASSGYG